MASSTALYRNKELLQQRLRELPQAPGIYRFYDVSGALIYVGKSVTLRDRVRSYFTGRASCKKIRRMRQEISRLDWEETGSELEALLLESRLVKKHQPRFNVMLREFVPLPYVRVDFQEAFPRLQVTRAPARDGATYFGPFRSQASLEAGVAALNDALRLRDCDIASEKLVGHRACYRHEFGTCSAPCLALIAAEEYRRAVEKACTAFEGREQSVIDVVQRRMERAAERLQFEIAARLRDAIRHIQAVCGKQHALLSAVQDLSLVAACPAKKGAGLCFFVFRSGRLVLSEEVPFTKLQDPRSRQEWAVRLVLAWGSAPDLGAGRIDSALLDEIQIVTAWMKQKTRQGHYWQFPADAAEDAVAVALDAWLAEQAAPTAEELAA